MDRFGLHDYNAALLEEGEAQRAQRVTARRCMVAFAATGALVVVGLVGLLGVTSSTNAYLRSQLALLEVDKCTAAGKDQFDNNADKPLPCCPGTVHVFAPCRDTGEICVFCVSPDEPGGACTLDGVGVHDNNVHTKLDCCPFLEEVEAPCDECKFCAKAEGTDMCNFCKA
jgi:hypothetical protein